MALLTVSDRALAPMVLLGAAIGLGGGGSSSPLLELALQLVLAGLGLMAAASAWAGRGNAGAAAPGRPALLAAGLVLALPALQLVPLPPLLWQALPGRASERAALALVGAADNWMPFTQTPARTLAALLALAVPAAVLLLAAAAPLRARQRLLAVVVAGGAASVVLGAMQLADGAGGRWRIGGASQLGFLTGFQANRNAEADLLITAQLAAAACWAGRPGERGRGGRIADSALVVTVPLLVLGAVLTGSRMGIALLVPALAAALAIAAPRGGVRLVAGGLGALTVVAAAAALAPLPALERIAARFAGDGDTRWQLWADTREAIARTWPAGSGIGSFQPVFLASERLEYVDPSLPVRAHNDWLEFTLEGGLAGWAVLAAIAVLLGQGARRRWAELDSPGLPAAARVQQRAQLLFAAATLAVLGLHALVDYPLRSMALACLAALGAGMILSAPGHAPQTPAVAA